MKDRSKQAKSASVSGTLSLRRSDRTCTQQERSPCRQICNSTLDNLCGLTTMALATLKHEHC
ncbi:MAG: hypothetical protein RMX65_014470 [Nostoc sp. DedQUE01]